MAAIAGKGGAVLVPTGATVALTNEATTANTARTQYTITNVARRAIDRTTSVTVETSPDGVTWSAATGYVVRFAIGRVDFSAAQAAGTQVRVTGRYQPMVQSGQFTEWTADIEKDFADATVLGGDGWKRAVPTLKGGSGSLSGYWQDGYWFDAINADTVVVLWLDVDATARKRYACYAYVTKDSVGDKVDDLITEDVDFTADGEVVYVEG